MLPQLFVEILVGHLGAGPHDDKIETGDDIEPPIQKAQSCNQIRGCGCNQRPVPSFRAGPHYMVAAVEPP